MIRRILPALLAIAAVWAQPRQVSITIDDLPRGGDGGGRDLASIRAMTEKLLEPLRGIPVIGFVNAGRAQQLGDDGLQTDSPYLDATWRDPGQPQLFASGPEHHAAGELHGRHPARRTGD